ncbi:sulfatase [Vallitalea longa]|uniref:Sulfatase n=1 Tax=Vallitalea longa TaxID=2936439 RepID=A0A9W5Y7G9_9FIRM|nr:sulfatase-like hydrolase/transferase [Vallitalea longa]GKX28207.1 sulfatase [Vallitalea longa]
MKNKNVMILHTDQQRYDSLGCNGNKFARTENIDKLAKDGCRFTRHIAANTTCMPSRSSLLTGLYVPGHGVCSNGIPLWRRMKEDDPISDKISKNLFGQTVEDKIPTIADKLSEYGYQTALFGKLHLEPHLSPKAYNFYESYKAWEDEEIEKDNKPYYGFQTKKLIMGHGEQPCNYNFGHYGRWLNKNHKELARSIISGTAKTVVPSTRKDIYLSKLPSELHNTMWLADEVCNYIDKDRNINKPMFMFVGFPDPHHPFTPPEDIAKEFMDIPLPDFARVEDIVNDKPSKVVKTMKSRFVEKEDCAAAYRNTMASVHLIDIAVGKIINHLKEKGLYDDTIIIFTSDHGDYLGDFDMLMKNDIAFHNLLHVPFIIKDVKNNKLPSVMDIPMSNVDVMPTLLSMLNIDKDDYIQGIDIFDENNRNNTPMVTCFGVTTEYRNISIYDDTYRYTYYLETKEEELYNHKKDYKELNNLANNSDTCINKICSDFRAKLFQKHVECDLGIYHHYSLW